MDRPGDVFSQVFERMLAARIVFVNGEIDDARATEVMGGLLELERRSATAALKFYVNSPGGSMTSSLGIYHTLTHVRCPVETFAIGQAAGTALLVVAAGTKGERFALPHARFHVADVKASRGAKDEETLALAKSFDALLAKHTGRTEQEVADARGELFLSAKEAVAWGIVDQVIDELP